MGFGVEGFGFRVWGLGFGVLDLGFGVLDLGLGVLASGFWGLGFGGLGSEPVLRVYLSLPTICRLVGLCQSIQDQMRGNYAESLLC